MPAAGKLGRLAPHPERTHPRVHLGDHLTSAAATPAVVDWASKVKTWPMYLNDQIGDCTIAGVGHMIQAWTANASKEFDVTNTEVLAMYEKLSGYNPATGANDNGCVEQDVLQYLVKTGIAGHKIRAFAQVDPRNTAEMKQALDLFGTIYLGIMVPESMMEQFQDGQPFTNVGDDNIEGGHCIIITKWDTEYAYVVTWGTLWPMGLDFWSAYGEEAWVIVTNDWIEKNGKTPAGLNLQSLLKEFDEITGQSKCSQGNWFQRAWCKIFS